MLSHQELDELNERYLPDARAAQEKIDKQVATINAATHKLIATLFEGAIEGWVELPRPTRIIVNVDRTQLAAWHLVDDWHLTIRGLVRIDRPNRAQHFRSPKTVERAIEVNEAVKRLLPH